jgi:hypothetical protein
MMRLALTAVLLAASLGAVPGSGQDVARPREIEIAAALEASGTEQLLAALSEGVGGVLSDAAPRLEGPLRVHVGVALREAFAPELLHRDVAAFVRDNPDRGQWVALREGLLSADFGALRRRMNPDVMPASFQSHAEYLQANPAPEGRFDLVGRLVFAQHAGEVSVLTADGLRAAVTRVAERAVGPGTASRGLPSQREDQIRAEDVEITSFVSLLRRLEPLTNEEVERLVEAYESPSGQWWVAMHRDAVLAALDAAAERAIVMLR